MYSQKTSGAGLTNLIMSYYDKRLLERLTPKLRFAQLGEKKPLPKHSGKTITFNRYRNLTGRYSLLTEGSTGSQVVLSSDKITATIIQLGAYAVCSDLVDMTAITSVVEEAIDVLSDKAAKDIDTYVRNTVTFICDGYEKRSSLRPQSALTATKDGRIYSGTSWGEGFALRHNKSRISTSCEVVSIARTAMSVKTIRDAVTSLKEQDIPPMADGYYVGIIHPTVADQLRDDGAFKTWNQYQHPDKMFKGEIGHIEGVRFLESTNAPYFTLTGDALYTASGKLFGTMIVGKGAYGVTNLEGSNALEMIVKRPNNADTSNPLNTYSTIGYKWTGACRVLNKTAGVIVLTTEVTG